MTKIIPKKDETFSTILILLMLITGSLLSLKMYDLKGVLDKTDFKYKNLSNIVYLMCLLVFIFPIILLIINVSGLYKNLKFLRPYESIVRIQIFVLIYSIILMIMLIYLYSKIRIENITMNLNLIWTSIGLLILGSIFLVASRYYNDNFEKKSILENFYPSKFFSLY